MMQDKVLFVGGVADGKRMICELLPQVRYPKPLPEDDPNYRHHFGADLYELERFRDGDRIFYIYAWKNPVATYSVLEKILDGYCAKEDGE